MLAAAAAAALSSCIEVMERLTAFFLVVSAAFSLCKCGGVAAAAFQPQHETNVSLHYLESVYGIANAAAPPNALMVGLTLIHGAAAKGAGISLSLTHKIWDLFLCLEKPL